MHIITNLGEIDIKKITYITKNRPSRRIAEFYTRRMLYTNITTWLRDTREPRGTTQRVEFSNRLRYRLRFFTTH